MPKINYRVCTIGRQLWLTRRYVVVYGTGKHVGVHKIGAGDVIFDIDPLHEAMQAALKNLVKRTSRMKPVGGAKNRPMYAGSA